MSALLNYNVCIYIVYMYIYTLYVSIVFQLPQHGLYFHLIDKYMKICVSYNLLIFLLVIMLNLIQLFYKHLNIYLLDRAPSGLPHSFSHFPLLVSVHVVNQMKSNSIRISNRNRSSGSTDLFTALFRYRIDVSLHK